MTTIYVISGFLGAGKTTFIQRLLKEKKWEHTVLIENEFGEIGVDSDFLKESGIQIRELNSGCICCSLVGDFREALHKVQEQYQPEVILIEPSGVGKLSDIQAAIASANDEHDFTIGSSVVIVDAKKCKMYAKNFKEFYEDQVHHADVIICSHIDAIDEAKLTETVALLKGMNDHAKIVTTDYHTLSASEIVELMNSHDEVDELMHHHHHEEHCCCHDHDHHHDDDECCDHHHHDDDEECYEHHHHHDDEDVCCEHHHHHDHEDECCGHHHDGEHHHHHHDADEMFTSWGAETVHRYSEDELRTIIDTVMNDASYGTVLRMKGMLSDGTTWHYFDVIPEEITIREGKPCYTGKICVIGKDLEQDRLADVFRLR